MPTYGKASHIEFAAHDISPYVTSVSFERDNDIIDVTCYGATGHTYGASLTDGKIVVNGLWDKTASVGSQVVLVAFIGDTDGDTFIWGPEGSASGKVKYSGTAVLESYTESAPVADLVSFAATLRISGTVTTGTFS